MLIYVGRVILYLVGFKSKNISAYAFKCVGGDIFRLKASGANYFLKTLYVYHTVCMFCLSYAEDLEVWVIQCVSRIEKSLLGFL